MKLYSMIIGGVFVGALGLQAQAPASHIAEAKQLYVMIENNMVAMADKMPDDAYSFKATPDVRTFGQLVAHVADVQARFCSTVTGEVKSVNAGSKTAKADLVTALKASADMCNAAWDALNETTAKDPVSLGPIKGSKLMLMEFNTSHTNEEYGYMAVYMRLKEVVPPSSTPRGR